MKANQVWDLVEQIHEKSPLVHNITNYVVMNSTANALLAIGASPVMAHAEEEIVDMIKISSALVINIGTLSSRWIGSMKSAVVAASLKGIPIVLDPVGAGATKFRTQTCLELINLAKPAVIRGNASEIMALVNAEVQTKGVDSTQSSESALEAANALANRYHCVVSVSGVVDLITNGKEVIKVQNGDAMMPKVTGLGCTATALTGAFVAVCNDSLEAAAAAMYVMGICGELAAEKAAGPGTLQLHLIDAFYNLNKEQVVGRIAD